MIETLEQAITKLDIVVNQEQKQQLLAYVDLIEKWNKIYNLTSIKGKENILNQHIVDSLSVLKLIKETPLLDIGSGAGLPGIVIAIMKPNLKVSVLDSIGKKCRFMLFVKTQLKLDKLTVVNKRVEDYKQDCFGQIISRAFSSIIKNINLSQHLLCDDGTYLLMKGDNFKKEQIANLQIIEHCLVVPNVSNKRYLLEIKNANQQKL